ncbi:hypothetical protein MVEN_02310100 [Mycena venus]|uniref:Uncharacterized protein n=1 Tax=Mycena venus TaxID=2733690 RepID=A0A8H7CEA1_9AGAR|nr:hypothetical protein MVEN_02310100 [Mycena venus]
MEQVPEALHSHQRFVKRVLERDWKHSGLPITIHPSHLNDRIEGLVTVKSDLALDYESANGSETGFYEVTCGFERQHDESEDHWQALWGVFWMNDHIIKIGGPVAKCRRLYYKAPVIIFGSSQRKVHLVGYSDPSYQGIFTTEWPAELRWQYFVVDLEKNVRARWADKGNEGVARDEKSVPGKDTVKWKMGSLEELFGALPEPVATEAAGNVEDVSLVYLQRLTGYNSLILVQCTMAK